MHHRAPVIDKIYIIVWHLELSTLSAGGLEA
jgi:hypothetical protein